MQWIGLGVDIVEIARIRAIYIRYGDRLARRLLHQQEWLAYQQSRQPIRLLAKRFAVKEAAAKALGTGIQHGITWRDFAVQHGPQGQPQLLLYYCAAETASKRGVNHYWVSIADERHYAVATVLLSR